jgi:hypothetical protein
VRDEITSFKITSWRLRIFKFMKKTYGQGALSLHNFDRSLISETCEKVLSQA